MIQSINTSEDADFLKESPQLHEIIERKAV